MRRMDGMVSENKDTLQIIKEELISSQKKQIQRNEQYQEQIFEIQSNLREKLTQYLNFIHQHG